jgi:hypothetical protein
MEKTVLFILSLLFLKKNVHGCYEPVTKTLRQALQEKEVYYD